MSWSLTTLTSQVPQWATEPYLEAAMIQQTFSPDRISPDQIFAPNNTCDLMKMFENVFENSSPKQQKR
jgi:hypothetical protein